MVPDELLEEVAKKFSYLADPTRLRVLSSLHAAGEVSVGGLAELTGIPVANVSQHLNRLAVGGIVSRRREGTSIKYRVADPTIERLCTLVCSTIDAAPKRQVASQRS